MKTCHVTFKRCLQNAQVVGTDNEHMGSRVFFDLTCGGHTFVDLHVDIKQVTGAPYEGGDIEVGRPVGYRGAFNYAAFRDEVERYYRDLIGSQGRMIHFGPGAQNITMIDNLLVMEKHVQFEVDAASGGW